MCILVLDRPDRSERRSGHSPAGPALDTRLLASSLVDVGQDLVVVELILTPAVRPYVGQLVVFEQLRARRRRHRRNVSDGQRPALRLRLRSDFHCVHTDNECADVQGKVLLKRTSKLQV